MSNSAANRVTVTTRHPGYEGRPVVLVDGELMRNVTRIELDHDYSTAGALATVRLTLIAVDLELDADLGELRVLDP